MADDVFYHLEMGRHDASRYFEALPLFVDGAEIVSLSASSFTEEATTADAPYGVRSAVADFRSKLVSREANVKVLGEKLISVMAGEIELMHETDEDARQLTDADAQALVTPSAPTGTGSTGGGSGTGDGAQTGTEPTGTEPTGDDSNTGDGVQTETEPTGGDSSTGDGTQTETEPTGGDSGTGDGAQTETDPTGTDSGTEPTNTEPTGTDSAGGGSGAVDGADPDTCEALPPGTEGDSGNGGAGSTGTGTVSSGGDTTQTDSTPTGTDSGTADGTQTDTDSTDTDPASGDSGAVDDADPDTCEALPPDTTPEAPLADTEATPIGRDPTAPTVEPLADTPGWQGQEGMADSPLEPGAEMWDKPNESGEVW